MNTYKILEENEADSIETRIEKSGITTEFVLREIYDHMLALEKDIKAKQGAIEVAEAKMTNIVTNHKDVAKVIEDIKGLNNSEGILATMFLWIKEDIDRDTNRRMIAEREAVIVEYKKELDDIHEALSIPRPIKIAYAKSKK